jgi:hypothetical protein
MTRETTFLLSLALLVVAAACVSASGWILFVRDHRASRTAGDAEPQATDATRASRPSRTD